MTTKTYTVILTITDDRQIDTGHITERIQRELEEGRPPFNTDGTRGVASAIADTFVGDITSVLCWTDDVARLTRVKRFHKELADEA